MKIKRLIGSKAFYKMALSVSVPIMLQNFITNFVSMLDNLMVGSLGTEQVSGVAIVNQILFIFNLAVFGGLCGIGIFTAQYYGKEDTSGMRYTLRCKFMLAFLLTAAAVPVLLLFDDNLISLFLHGSSENGNIELTLAYAKEYLRIAVIGLLPYALAAVFATTLRETGDTLAPVLSGVAAILVNTSLNYVLIFGKFGFPELGVRGAAIATTVSRFVELAAIAVYVFAKTDKFTYVKGVFKSLYVPKSIVIPVLKKGSPLLMNEVLWATSMTALSLAYSLHGLNVVAAYSISSTITNLFNIVFMSMGVGLGIISGKLLGANKHDEAVDTVWKFIALSGVMSVVIGALMFGLGSSIPNLYKTDELSRSMAKYFIRVCALVTPFVSFSNACYFTLRSGGKTLITFFFDCGALWLLSVPLAFILYGAGLSIYWVFPIIQSLEFVKNIVGFILVKKRVWVHTII